MAQEGSPSNSFHRSIPAEFEMELGISVADINAQEHSGREKKEKPQPFPRLRLVSA
jgi:hypothetical protein